MTSTIDWNDTQTWKVSAKNTFWCLTGCAIGDFGTILFFQLSKIPFPLIKSVSPVNRQSFNKKL